jgi:FKBP-type peptidyl-prolyl cis-trans isomerase SlyD
MSKDNHQIADNKVVGIDYVLRDDAGEILDQSGDDGVFYFIQGVGNIVPGLEKVLHGKSVGESFKVAVTAEEGYGEFDEELIRRVPRKHFKSLEPIEEGQEIMVQGQDGDHEMATITGVEEDTVVIDSNHPLAGQNLHFEVNITEVRDASPEELEHGHVHGPGGHHH